MRRISATESEQRWKILTARATTLSASTSSKQQEHNEDPFDCSDLVVPTSQTLVDESVNIAVKLWKDLEERKVKSAPLHNEQQEAASKKRGRPEGWNNTNRLRLPEFFDYETRLFVPPQDSTGEKVVSLEDPSMHLSLEHELWNIFKNVPTLQEIESSALQGAACHHMRTLHTEMTRGILKQSRMDCHGLSRLRMCELHELPVCMNGEEATTIRLECWRRQLKRGSSPDGNRLVLELLGSQTLQDVHDVIVELSHDDLWDDSQHETELPSGLFFIEDTFYTTGTVNYVKNITTWLNDTNAGQVRRVYLGLPVNDEPLKVKTMSSIRLEQLEWRLGVRYVHVHHGDVECSVFLTDIKRGLISPKTTFPLVHDVWSPSYSVAECEACQRRVGVLCTCADNPLTNGGPRALCELCFKQLYPSGEMPSSATVLKYSVWRDQDDLSVGHQKTDAPF